MYIMITMIAIIIIIIIMGIILLLLFLRIIYDNSWCRYEFPRYGASYKVRQLFGPQPFGLVHQ